MLCEIHLTEDERLHDRQGPSERLYPSLTKFQCSNGDIEETP